MFWFSHYEILSKRMVFQNMEKLFHVYPRSNSLTFSNWPGLYIVWFYFICLVLSELELTCMLQYFQWCRQELTRFLSIAKLTRMIKFHCQLSKTSIFLQNIVNLRVEFVKCLNIYYLRLQTKGVNITSESWCFWEYSYV